MRTLTLALLALAAGACTATRSTVAEQGPAEPHTKSTQGAAPQAPLTLQVARHPGGEPYDVEGDRGSVVLLDVWATWCEPCRESLPLYMRLASKYGAQGLKVYALSVDEDSAGITPFLQAMSVELPVLFDPEGQVVSSQLGVRVVPTSVLLDRRGVVRYVHEGFDDSLPARYIAEIEELLAEAAP